MSDRSWPFTRTATGIRPALRKMIRTYNEGKIHVLVFGRPQDDRTVTSKRLDSKTNRRANLVGGKGNGLAVRSAIGKSQSNRRVAACLRGNYRTLSDSRGNQQLKVAAGYVQL